MSRLRVTISDAAFPSELAVAYKNAQDEDRRMLVPVSHVCMRTSTVQVTVLEMRPKKRTARVLIGWSEDDVHLHEVLS
jgi:hypothetical protein